MFWFSGHEACGILAPRPTSPALEGNVITTGPPGKSLNLCLVYTIILDNQSVTAKPNSN